MPTVAPSYTDEEKELLILKATWESIDSMVNFRVLDLNYNDPDSSITFKTDIHQEYFGILLLDFLHMPIWGISNQSKSCLDALQKVLEAPLFNSDVESLRTIVGDFRKWLTQEVEFEHDGETRKLWFPSIDQEIALKITREDFIKICGNISKHNPLGLSYQAEAIQRIFVQNNITIELHQALLIMGEFYEQFHDDLFNYHSSTIAEFLNNLRWAIYEYLQPLFDKSVEHYEAGLGNNQLAYRYNYPEGVSNDYTKEIFWGLMNDVRSRPYVPKFQVSRYFKLRY